MDKKPVKLFDSELKVMDVLWKEGDVQAKHVADVLAKEVGWNKNTTYTLIKRCIKKGAIERLEPHFVCRALISKEEVQEAETNELIDKIYDGSADKLFAALLGRKKLSMEQIEKLKQIVADSERGITFMSVCLIVFAAVILVAISAITSNDLSRKDTPAIDDPQTNAKETAADKQNAMSITHESADILHYEDGAPYIHDILTNNTDRTIVETQYGMLAYNENGSPLKLYWNFLDSSAESSYENIVRTQENLLSNQTEEYRGGWSLYDGEIMEDFPKVGDGGANQAAYSLVCLKQVVFEDGKVWNNPTYEDWLKTYAGRETEVVELQNYYPHEYEIELD